MKRNLFGVVFLFMITKLCSHPISYLDLTQNYSHGLDSLPIVFQIGEYSDQYEKFISKSQTLLQVNNNDVYLAYEKWLHTMSDLEATCKTLGVSLNGCKFWFSIVYNPNGSIKHLAYYIKSNARNTNLNGFKEILPQFIANYKMPITTANSFFYNYGSAAFPIPDRNPVARKK